MTKIIDKIISFRKKAKRNKFDFIRGEDDDNLHLPGEWFYSFEFFPPKTEAGLDNLLTRIDRMSNRLDPLFIDVTWGESGSTSVRSIAVASHAQRYCGVDALLHLTCTGMTKDQIASVLRQVKSHGVQNILALRGDPPRGKPSWFKDDVSGGECDRAIDLIKLIRELHGDYFCIACAGHPEGHPSSHSQELELIHLKEKIEAGADFVITQFFYDADIFLDYVQKCRAAGITCPILPGILPIQSYSSFTRMTSFFHITVPEYIMKRLEPVKEDDEAVKEIGCEIAIDIATKILTTPLDKGGMDGVHFYTLNLERSVTRILMAMNAVSTVAVKGHANPQQTSPSLAPISSSRRQYPWRPSAMERREKEDVRPINWANRPTSYVLRTEDWDEFPNGRWGDSTSPAFGELSDLSHFYSFSLGTEEDRLAMLGPEPLVPQDVYEVFAKYVEGKVPHLPWCETTLKPESFIIQSKLAHLNRLGFLTINSQPAIKGIASSNSVFGWGGPGGYVYQKGYIECFVSPENLPVLLDMVSKQESLNLYAVNYFGEEIREGVDEGGVTALTWGVFPNREILQPTIFDPQTFLIWAEEAFSLWTSMWLNLYDFESKSYHLIEGIRDTYFLVAIIDNDFVSSDGGSLCDKILEAKQQLR